MSRWTWPRALRAVTFALALAWMYYGGPRTLTAFISRMLIGAVAIILQWTGILALAIRRHARTIGHGPPWHDVQGWTHCGDCGRTSFPARCYAGPNPTRQRERPCMPVRP